jgi:hypothetical protein
MSVTSIKTNKDDWTISSKGDSNPKKTVSLSTENVIKMDVGSFGSDVKPLKEIDLSKFSAVNTLSKLAQKEEDEDDLQYVASEPNLKTEGADDPNDITYAPQDPSNAIVPTELRGTTKSSLASTAFSSFVSFVGKIGKGIIVDIPVAALKFLASIPGKVQFALLEQEKSAIAENKELNQAIKERNVKLVQTLNFDETQEIFNKKPKETSSIQGQALIKDIKTLMGKIGNKALKEKDLEWLQKMKKDLNAETANAKIFNQTAAGYPFLLFKLQEVKAGLDQIIKL